MNRREFIKSGMWGLALVPVAGALITACTKKEEGSGAAGGLSMLSESDPVANALGYVSDASRADKARFPGRAKAENANQLCSNCVQFTAIDGSAGKCNIFVKNSVAAKGWCNSWVAKPKA